MTAGHGALMRADELLPDPLTLHASLFASVPRAHRAHAPAIDSLSGAGLYWGLKAAEVVELRALQEQLPLADCWDVQYDACDLDAYLRYQFESRPRHAFLLLAVVQDVARSITGADLEMWIHPGPRPAGLVRWTLFLCHTRAAATCS